jgi:hypothetical protein
MRNAGLLGHVVSGKALPLVTSLAPQDTQATLSA